MRDTLPEDLTVQRIPLPGGASLAADWLPPRPGSGGRCAVFVHGLGSNRRGEKALHFAERFAAQGWGFLSLDLRGHGDSDGALRDLTMTGMLEDLAATLDWLRAQQPDGGPPVLIGSSMGGAVAAWHALAHPRETGCLALIAPSLQFPGRLGWQLGPAAMEEWKRTGLRRFESDWIDLEIGFGLMEDALNYDPQKLLLALATPTLIFHGMRDTAVDWRISLGFLEDCRYPHLELVLLKDGDHRLTDRKALLFETLWAWLARRDGGGGQRHPPPS
jgi:pimeloyl-ACP methyl ester carboxylesterase